MGLGGSRGAAPIDSEKRKGKGEDLICSRVEDEVGECVLDCGVEAVGAVGEEEKREQGEEEAEDWDWDEEEVVLEVDWKSKDIIPPTHVCHADAIDDIAKDGEDDIHECEPWGEPDERLC